MRAEELGLHSFWVNDTPMVHGDPFIALALCAKATGRIRLGIGVTSPALRSAPAAASALASLNALAPGRIICGVGTGNTARRTLGMRPTTAATLEHFTAALQDLCAGRSPEYREGDRVRDIRFLHAGAHVNTAAPIEFVVAALLGPKAAAVAWTPQHRPHLLRPSGLHRLARPARRPPPRRPRHVRRRCLSRGLLPGHLAAHTRRGRGPPWRRGPGRDGPPRPVAAGLRRRHSLRDTRLRRATRPRGRRGSASAPRPTRHYRHRT